MKTQTVTLRFTYNEENDPPMDWDWSVLCDLERTELVEVISSTDIEDVPESSTNED